MTAVTTSLITLSVCPGQVTTSLTSPSLNLRSSLRSPQNCLQLAASLLVARGPGKQTLTLKEKFSYHIPILRGFQ